MPQEMIHQYQRDHRFGRCPPVACTEFLRGGENLAMSGQVSIPGVKHRRGNRLKKALPLFDSALRNLVALAQFLPEGEFVPI